MPFELSPSGQCASQRTRVPAKGILLIHGLSDMPFAMHDLPRAFAKRCFLIRVILLPGQGSRAGDLLNVSRTDWLNATGFGLETLKKKLFSSGKNWDSRYSLIA